MKKLTQQATQSKTGAYGAALPCFAACRLVCNGNPDIRFDAQYWEQIG